MSQKNKDPMQVDATRLIALRIRELCFMNNMTLSDLAARSEMPLSSLRDIINGKNADIRFSSLVKISVGLNVDLAYFFETEHFQTWFLTRGRNYNYS